MPFFRVHVQFYVGFAVFLRVLIFRLLVKRNISLLEINTNPPAGGRFEKTIINRIYMFSITRFDLASVFATKLHACFYRKFTKGRDFYDFIWYLTKKITPNFYIFNNTIEQTEGKTRVL